MSGFAGIARRSSRPIDHDVLWRMADAIRHRGPDDSNIFTGERVGLAHVRLKMDEEGGAEPFLNADDNIIIALDGAIFNRRELRGELESAGYRFRTGRDEELLMRAYDRWGEAMLKRLNGQFAFALYDRRNELVFLARDRFGVCPLFITQVRGDLLFASEIKGLLASGELRAELDLQGLDEVFSLCAARAPRTVFRNVEQLEPGSCCTWSAGRLRTRRYFNPRYHEASIEPAGALETLDHLMKSSVALRLRADVPVAGHLSGGLDSSVTCALAARMVSDPLQTLSVTSDDPQSEERNQQLRIAHLLSTRHNVVQVGASDIANVFPDVVWHAETPLLRTAAAPRYLLARAARDAGIRVVLAEEGSNELFLGYDLFKETMIRLFCLRQPESRVRARLFERLYPDLAVTAQAGDFWRRFFLDAIGPDDALFSHVPRFLLAARIKDFYSPEVRLALAGSDPLAELRQSLPQAFPGWSPENRAAYVELTTQLPSYLLSSVGDRVTKAHGVESRFPFLDYRLFEFAASLPSRSKLLGLREKEILRRWAAQFLPFVVTDQARDAYRSPEASAFFTESGSDYVQELLSEEAIRRTGIFDPSSVAALVRRCVAGRVAGAGESQALVAILSTQLWHHAFLERRPRRSGTPARSSLVASL
ncbi:MAG TPA: asparagine synthase (glutamine-hydrolyzing) [Gemmatimonadaceae bacterium]|nr:asparagine synthase (glutamine-hydrolyzing) [Gemmatimonadaceae bacterium]